MDVPPPNTRLGSAHEALIDSIRTSDTNKDDLPVCRRISASLERSGCWAWHGGFARCVRVNTLTATRVYSARPAVNVRHHRRVHFD